MSMIGQTIGAYQIVGELGRGGMAVVYKAFQPSLNRYVALKVLPDYFQHDPEFVARFKQEAQAAAQLSHPNVVVIYDVGEDAGVHYIAMEYLEGGSLSDRLEQAAAQGWAYNPQEALSVVEQVGSALDYAHSRNLVHRDIKPANILFDANGRPKVTDFGIARAGDLARLTRTGVLMGTPEYMSPEQASGGQVDPRSDLYALGVMAYEMLTGRVPFQSDTPHATLHAVVYEQPPAPRQVNPGLSQAVEAVLLQALAKQPEARFQRGAALAGALKAALSGQTPSWAAVAPPAPATAFAAPQGRSAGSTPPRQPVTPPPAYGYSTPPPSQRRAMTWLWLLGGAIVLAAAALVVLLLLRGCSNEEPIAAATNTPISAAPAATTAPAATEVTVAVDTPIPGVTPSDTPLPTDTPQPSDTPLPTDTPTGTPQPSDTPTQTPTSTNTPTATPTLTPTPTVTPTPTCAVAVDGELAPAWDRGTLGCPTGNAAIVWSAWETFQRGSMWWRQDTDWAYVFHWQGGSDPTRGDWTTGGNSWKWDGSFPDGHGLTPPAGLLEPVRGFGFVWYNYLGGEASQIGWATFEEMGICSKVQKFEQGTIWHSSTAACSAEYNRAVELPAPLFFVMQNNGNWRRY